MQQENQAVYTADVATNVVNSPVGENLPAAEVLVVNARVAMVAFEVHEEQAYLLRYLDLLTPNVFERRENYTRDENFVSETTPVRQPS